LTSRVTIVELITPATAIKAHPARCFALTLSH